MRKGERKRWRRRRRSRRRKGSEGEEERRERERERGGREGEKRYNRGWVRGRQRKKLSLSSGFRIDSGGLHATERHSPVKWAQMSNGEVADRSTWLADSD